VNNIIDLAVMRRNYIKLTVSMFIAILSMLLFNHLDAAEVTKKVIISSSIERDSNPNLSESNTNPVWIYTLTPQLLLGIEDDSNLWYLDAAVLFQKHSNEKVLVDREDPRFAAGWDRTYSSGKYGIRLNYIESSARIAELKSVGVFDNIDNTQRIKTISANWLHNIDARWSNLADASFSDVLFTAPGRFQNYRVGDIKTKLSYEYTEKLNTSILLGYAHLRPENLFKSTDLFRLGLGSDYQINEALTFSARAGLYDLNGRQSDTDWEAGFKAGYTSDRSFYSAELNRDLAVSGLGGFQKSDAFAVKWLYNKSTFDRIGVDYGLSKSIRDRQVNLTPVDFQQIGAFYEYDFSDKWKTRIYATYKDQVTDSTKSHGNLIGISLTYDTLSF
jgi:hypothetical protein